VGSGKNGVVSDEVHRLLKENERLAVLVTTLHDAKLRLEHDVVALEERVRRYEELQASLLEQIARMGAANQAVAVRTLELEQLNSPSCTSRATGSTAAWTAISCCRRCTRSWST
jgi:hypothetical protein